VFLRWRARAFLPDGSGWFQRAQTLADAGRYDDALADLERAFAAHEPSLVKLHSTPEFAPLRASPRYQALWEAIGPA
jgi:hypothetical protein